MRRLVAILGCTLALGCGDDQVLTQSLARIRVCQDVLGTECDIPIDLGDVTIGSTTTATLYVLSRGTAPLEISRVRTEQPLSTRFGPTAIEPAGERNLDIALDLTSAELGPSQALLTIESNDFDSPQDYPIVWNGIPAPDPELELCTATSSCAIPLDIEMDVRRTQREGATVIVRNRGPGPLRIESLNLQAQTSIPGELTLESSTRGGVLEPGRQAALSILYAPADGIEDTATLTVTSNDPTHPMATVNITARSAENQPPVAAIRTSSTARFFVGIPIALDGTDSADPEGDPLVYQWSMLGPMTSTATLADANAARAAFVPDVVGDYTIRLEVTDSLAQTSLRPAQVVISVVPRHRLRVDLGWIGGGDVDLHLVPSGAALFSSQDCHFGQPIVALGDPNSDADDLMFVSDSTVAPGREAALVAEPIPGDYDVYAHYFDDLGGRTATVTAEIRVDDAASPNAQFTLGLARACDLWRVGTATFPSGQFTASATATTTLCP